MRRPSSVLALLGCLLASSCDGAPPETAAPQAPGPKKSRLFAPDPWTTGDTVTETGTYAKATYGNVPDGAPKPEPRVIGVDYEIVRRCTEADVAGHWVRGEVAIRRWVLTGGPAPDRTIEGTTVVLESDGKYTFVKPPEQVSPSAKTWIEQTLAGRLVVAGDGDGVAPEDWPAEELTVGVPVPVRILSIERGLAKMEIPFPAEGIVGQVVLKEVETTALGPRISFALTSQASLEGKGKARGKDVTYLPGSAARHATAGTKILGACRLAASLVRESAIVTVIETEQGPMRSEAVERTTMARTK